MELIDNTTAPRVYTPVRVAQMAVANAAVRALRDRGQRGEPLHERLGGSLDGFGRLDGLQKTASQRLVSADELGQQQHAFHPLVPEGRAQARHVGDGQAIAQGLGNRHAELRARRGQSEVARGRNRQPAAHAPALDHGHRGHGQVAHQLDAGLDLALVGHTVFAGLESGELLDVGAGHEGLPTGAAEHGHPHAAVAGELAVDGRELLVHGPGHRVARLGSVKQHRGHAGLDLQAHLALVGHASALSCRS